MGAICLIVKDRSAVDQAGMHAGGPFDFGNEIQECYAAAETCRQNAELAVNSEFKADYLVMASRWVSHAHSYEFARLLSAPGDLMGEPARAA